MIPWFWLLITIVLSLVLGWAANVALSRHLVKRYRKGMQETFYLCGEARRLLEKYFPDEEAMKSLGIPPDTLAWITRGGSRTAKWKRKWARVEAEYGGIEGQTPYVGEDEEPVVGSVAAGPSMGPVGGVR